MVKNLQCDLVPKECAIHKEPLESEIADYKFLEVKSKKEMCNLSAYKGKLLSAPLIKKLEINLRDLCEDYQQKILRSYEKIESLEKNSEKRELFDKI